MSLLLFFLKPPPHPHPPTALPTVSLFRAPITSMVLNPVAIPLGFLLLELSAALNKRITPRAFKGFLCLASGTLHPPGLPPHSLAGPHQWLVLFALISPVGLYVVGHLGTQRLVLFSLLSILNPLVMITSGFKYHPHV